MLPMRNTDPYYLKLRLQHAEMEGMSLESTRNNNVDVKLDESAKNIGSF